MGSPWQLPIYLLLVSTRCDAILPLVLGFLDDSSAEPYAHGVLLPELSPEMKSDPWKANPLQIPRIK